MVTLTSNAPLDSVTNVESIANNRTSPGILVFTASMQLLYMNREARELSGRINETPDGRRANGVLPIEVTGLCDEVLRLLRAREDTKDWEHVQLRRVVGHPTSAVLIRAFAIPSSSEMRDGRVLIMMEEIGGRKEAHAERAKERFRLTDREQTVVIYLIKGLTNKEIANRLMVAEQTVKEHVKHIMQKTKANTRTGVLSRILFGSGG